MSKIGVALSGGGARGIAHLGVLQALDDMGLKIHALSGTSSGAIVGAFYAGGMPPKEVLELIIKTSLYKFLRPAISRTGLLKIQQLRRLFYKNLPQTSFHGLQRKLTVVATDVVKGQSAYFSDGDLIDCILASCCMPVIFDPIEIEGVTYIDGGILNNLPIEPLLNTCNVIVGSHCNPVDANFKVKNAKALLERTLLMAIRNNTLIRRDQCHIYLEPAPLEKYIGSDFGKAREIYQIGYDHTWSQRTTITDLLDGLKGSHITGDT